MSSIATGNTSQQPRLADGGIPNAVVHGVIESSDPFELFEGAHSISSVSDAHKRSSRHSDASSERLDRLEGLLEGMARQKTQFSRAVQREKLETDKMIVFEVHRRNDVLMINVMGEKTAEARFRVVKAKVLAAGEELAGATTVTMLQELHERLGRIAYDTVERMADTIGSGIRLTDRARPNCLTCARVKQSKNHQSKKDSGANAPVNKIGDVIGSDIKGPMTLNDRLGNRYLIDPTNYVRVFLAKNKVEATRNIKQFLIYIEKRLRTLATLMSKTIQSCHIYDRRKHHLLGSEHW
ncbi:hypothetical protein PC116_g10291 [Phytophthora cactorum]|uniref:Uncharacterized protein n=1 Tax=Phytophthora cactorum TaxID=29920 RepID=A0A329RWM5_9STRA|nr:hypothetical protein Pcac1_g6434 [Phytophthora cactorum]KAG2802759.1 hypothetical protein PC111_g18966 [Phytophthora cactorum]KAG2805866.1 hypothetical protein PC112_g18077 [Phytophthora cactorum]KAG2891799.1 hypothetical protein PC114_g16850 [Phytophthora cactorum]KAG2902560.1 hypothetical protein PC117_g21454 [Phytophthora cactorum]